MHISSNVSNANCHMTMMMLFKSMLFHNIVAPGDYDGGLIYKRLKVLLTALRSEFGVVWLVGEVNISSSNT